MQIRWLKTKFEYNDWRRYVIPPRPELRLQQKIGKEWQNIPVETETKFV